MPELLIVEDDSNKCNQLREWLHSKYPSFGITERKSYQSGLKEIVDSKPDLVLLDMSMPTYDITPQDKGGMARAYAGRDILDELVRRKLPASVIVVTQYETFGEGDDKKSLSRLTEELSVSFEEIYLGTVYYHPGQSDWQSQLGSIIQSFLGGTLEDA